MKIAEFKFKIKFRDEIYLNQFKGSMFRGAFGYALKKVCCIKRYDSCKECKLKYKCFYAKVFEPFCEDKHFIYGIIKDAPRPYIFSFNDKTDKNQYFKNETFEFSIILLNEFINNFSFILYAIISMGEFGLSSKRIAFDVISVSLCNKTNGEYLIYENETLNSINNNYLTEFKKEDFIPLNIEHQTKINNLKFEFRSPLRYRKNKKLVDKVDFRDIFNLVIRRVSIILFFYDKINEPLFDYRKEILDVEKVEIIEERLKWTDWGRFSTRQNSNMKFGGIVGEICFKLNGFNYKKFELFFKLCEKINIGKNCTFGNGKIVAKIN